MLRRGESRHLDKRVTFASPNVTAEAQKGKKTKPDQRKRQTQQHPSQQKKAKHAEQLSRLQQCEEILVDVDYGCKTITEKAKTQRQSATAALDEMTDLMCDYADQDNQLVALEEEIHQLENSLSREADDGGKELETDAKNLEQFLAKHTELDQFLSELTDKMVEADEHSDQLACFYDALPTLERMLEGLSM